MSVFTAGRRNRLGGLTVATVLLGMIAMLSGTSAAWAGYASIMVDLNTGEVLNEVNADDLNHPASLTKMMTLYLTFEALKQGRITMDTEMPVSEFAASKTPTKLGLPAGDTVSVHECVLGMIVLSANDCAAVAGEYLAGGSETAFARIMTEKAHALGMTNTQFRNASGLPDDEQVTTARDLTKLATHLYEDFPEYYHFFSTRSFNFRGREIQGHNRLMYRYPGMDGLKTGFTSASGFNLAASAERDGHRLVGVVMGSYSAPARDRLMATLLDNGFAHQPTDPALVAAAGGQSTRVASRIGRGAHAVLASMESEDADAAELAPAPRTVRQVRMVHGHRRVVIVAVAPASKHVAQAHSIPAALFQHANRHGAHVVMASAATAKSARHTVVLKAAAAPRKAAAKASHVKVARTPLRSAAATSKHKAVKLASR